MFEKLNADQWQVVLGVAGFLITTILTVAIWTLRYMIKVEKNTSATSASTTALVNSLKTLKEDNDEDHRVLHGRIDEAQAELKGQGKTQIEHGVHIKSLLNKDCSS